MAHPEDEDRLVRDVAEQGYCVVPGALGADELATMREAFDADRRAHPRCWERVSAGRESLLGEFFVLTSRRRISPRL
eukprot:COSAG06_NODE_14_length_35011_cov_20.984132_21_plen_77_part_00